MSSGLVVLQASDLQQLNFLHQGNTRLRVICFDLCPSFILLGANSGTIYILDHETLNLKTQIPVGSGCVTQLSISHDEQQVACALSNGTVKVFEMQQSKGGARGRAQPFISSQEHLGHAVSSMVWAHNSSELYIGDDAGKVSILYVLKSKTASLFRSPCMHLMTLESSITQLDFQEGYLLVSTLTCSYICNTGMETFTQVGTKLRQGEYGGCFCQMDRSSGPSPTREPLEKVEGLQSVEKSLSSSEKFSLSDCYEALEENQTTTGVEKLGGVVPAELTSLVFCARPGTRIWEADHTGKVLITHQLKNALMVPPAEVLLTDGSFGEKELLEEISILQGRDSLSLEDVKSAACRNEPVEKDAKLRPETEAMHPPVSVAFTKLLSFYNKYLLATSTYGLYIIDPANSRVLVWVSVSDGVTDVKVSGNSLIYKAGNGCIKNFMITTVDIAILVLHTRNMLLECTSLCLKNQSVFVTSELLSRLGVKILTDLYNHTTNDVIKDKLSCFRSIIGADKEKLDANFSKRHGVTYVRNENFETEEIKAGLTTALKLNCPTFPQMPVMRWSSEPHLGGRQGRTGALRSVSVQSSPVHQVKGNRTTHSIGAFHYNTQSHVSLKYFSSEDTLRSTTEPSTASCRHSSGSNNQDFNLTLSSGCSQKSGNISPHKSLDSSLEMYEDPLFPPEDSSPDLEMASQILMDSQDQLGQHYAPHSFYNMAFTPIHPGSEAAVLLQDLVENVATNMVDSIALGTKNLTERLRSVAPLVSQVEWPSRKLAESVSPVLGVPGSSSTTDPDDRPQSTTSGDTDIADDIDTNIVIVSKSKKKSFRNKPTLPFSGKSCVQAGAEEGLLRPHPEIPGVIRNLHELVSSTVQQIINSTNKRETQHLLSQWFDVYCHTVHQIQYNKRLSPQASEDLPGDGPVSISSIDSSISVGSTGTSCDSLHWDSNDIGFEPSTMSPDILEQITELFLKCLQAEVYTSAVHTTQRFSHKSDLLQHPITPEHIKKQDSLYAQLITYDCGLLQYHYLLNSLESLGCHFYFFTWCALLEKVTKDSDTLTIQPLPDIIPDLEFTRCQRVSFLYKLASSDSTKSFISSAAQMDSPIVVQDVIFLLYYMAAHSSEQNCFATRAQVPTLLLQYLIESSHYRNLTKCYLDSWCLCSELQNDILSALLSVVNTNTTNPFSCECGMPLPLERPVALEILAETILLHDISDPESMAQLCQSLGYWKGYCIITLAYNIRPSSHCFPYIIQACDMSLLDDFLEDLHSDDCGMVFDTLGKVTSQNSSIILCFKCQNMINLTEKKSVITEDKAKFEYNFIVNSEPQSTGISSNEIHLAEARSNGSKSTEVQGAGSEGQTVTNVRQLWEAVVLAVLRRSGAADTLKLLTNVQDNIPPGVLSDRVYNWCILASVAERKGPAARWALLDSLCGTKTKLYSRKVFWALHRRSGLGHRAEQAPPQPNSSHGEQTPKMEQQCDPPPHTPEKPDLPCPPCPPGHHWGVWTEVLQGICYCCHLRLPTQALVNEGGITVFTCGHAYHTICLSQRGHHCIRCTHHHHHLHPLSLLNLV